MLIPSSDAGPDRRAQAARLLAQAMQRDVEGQRELIAARARGETDAVYWQEADRLAHQREQHHRRTEETQTLILRLGRAAQSVRASIARSRVLLDVVCSDQRAERERERTRARARRLPDPRGPESQWLKGALQRVWLRDQLPGAFHGLAV